MYISVFSFLVFPNQFLLILQVLKQFEFYSLFFESKYFQKVLDHLGYHKYLILNSMQSSKETCLKQSLPH